MRLLCAAVGLLLCVETQAQNPDAIRAAMAPSIEKQKESVRQQVSTTVHGAAPAATAPAAGTPAAGVRTPAPGVAAPPAFFTVEWPAPPGFAPLPATAPPDCDQMPAKDVDALVDTAAKQEGVKAELIRAVIEHESAFKPCALSAKGAQGLMQLMPSTADELHVADAFDPAENVNAGAKLLRMLLDKYGGDTRLALSAYNAGGGRVDQSGGVPDIPETQDYVSNILNRLAKDAAAAKPISEPRVAAGP
ncbi:MAG: lytic transglycosylase domain-containing protein [Bryobacteraceae bacterium]